MAEKRAGGDPKGTMISATIKNRLKPRSRWKPGASFSKNTGLHVAYVFESFSPFYMKALQQWKYIPC